jgi:hypothetical protein
MIFLPIVVRELQTASWRKKTYSVRFWTAVAAVVVCAAIIIFLSFVPLLPGMGWASMGWAIFQGLAGLCFFYCLLLAGNTADCVSEEKREGTLGLLFLTDLSGWDVALGKLCANSLKSFYALLGAFPVVAVVLLLGGVSAGQFCKVSLALLNIFFFSHAAGLLASVLCRALDRAHAVTLALLSGILAGPPLLALAFSSGRFGLLAPALAALSPGFAFFQAMAPKGGRFFWTSLLLAHFVSWFLLALASRRLPRCWQDKAGPARLRWRDRFRQWTYGPPDFRADLRRRLAGINPFLWLMSRNRVTPVIFRGFLGALSCIWIGCGIAAGKSECIVDFIIGICTNNLLMIAGVASEAGHHLEEQRSTGALEFVLCSTPVAVEEILAAQWMALRRQFTRPLIFVLVSDAAMAILGLCFNGAMDKSAFAWLVAAVMAILAVDLFAAGWVGMWRAMAIKRPTRNAAAGETIGLLIFLPCFFHVAIIISWAAAPQTEDFPDSFAFNLGLWFALALAVAAVLSVLARRRLLTRFRRMAVMQTGEPVGIIGQLVRSLGRTAP